MPDDFNINNTNISENDTIPAPAEETGTAGDVMDIARDIVPDLRFYYPEDDAGSLLPVGAEDIVGSVSEAAEDAAEVIGDILDASGSVTDDADTASSQIPAAEGAEPAQKKAKKSRKKKKRAKAMAAREEALKQAGLLTDTAELTTFYDTDTLELTDTLSFDDTGTVSFDVTETVSFDITDNGPGDLSEVSTAEGSSEPVGTSEIASEPEITVDNIPADAGERPVKKTKRPAKKTKKAPEESITDAAPKQIAEDEKEAVQIPAIAESESVSVSEAVPEEPVSRPKKKKSTSRKPAVQITEDSSGPEVFSAETAAPEFPAAPVEEVVPSEQEVLSEQEVPAKETDDTGDISAISPLPLSQLISDTETGAAESEDDGEEEEPGDQDDSAEEASPTAPKPVKKSRKKKKAMKKSMAAATAAAAAQGDPFQKTDGMLEREGTDLLNELAVTNGEAPIGVAGTGKTQDEEGPVSFDAVVNEDGAISGLLDEKDVKKSEKDEIPAVIAAASDKGKKEAAGASAKKEKKNKKDKKTDKNVVTGTSAKITGAKTRRVRKRASFWQLLVRFIIILMCIGILGGCALAVGVTMYIADVTVDDDKLLNIDNIKLSLATSIMVQDTDTGEWYEHERIYGGENREWVAYSDFPDCLIDSIIASEDIRFRTHHGVDWKRTAFAFLNQFLRIFGVELASNIQGGSTITQQLIKNITDEKQVEGLEGILRKVREIYRALEMEKNYSKTQILEAYLNTFRLGGQVAGIESAAKYYFGKTTSELDLAECCAIVCITKYPSAYNPYVNPEANKEQRDFILYTMLENEMITRTQYDAAIAESDEMVFDESNISAGATSNLYDYFTDVVIDQVYEDLKTYLNLSPDDAYTLLYEGGLKIYTTMNPKVQHACEKAAWDDDIWPDYEYDDDGNKLENQIEGAIVVMDYEGRVLGCAGGIREKTTSLSLSRAYSTTRQTGSSMKPLAVYAPALEMKKIHFSTLFQDVASDSYNGYPWPRNFSYTYGSPITVYKAVCDSLNTVAALTMQLVGPDFSFEYLTSSLGFTTLVDSRWDDYQGMYLTDRTKSLALGGLTDGCTVTEMCAAYATFGNKGVYKSPRYYTYIEDSNGDIVLDKNKVCQNNQAMSPQTAYIMNQILQGVTKEGTGTALNRGAEQVIASKTGTSSDNNDFWVCALNPYYCAAGWMGYDLNGWMNYSKHYDIQYAVRDVLNEISNDLPYKEFERPDGIVTATFCMSSGDIATSACPNRRTGYYTSDNYPSGSCMHSLYNNDGNGGYYSS